MYSNFLILYIYLNIQNVNYILELLEKKSFLYLTGFVGFL